MSMYTPGKRTHTFTAFIVPTDNKYYYLEDWLKTVSGLTMEAVDGDIVMYCEVHKVYNPRIEVWV